ncbi:TetR/AcrR family transcriptional regulator [Nocardia colli]|uniref:TetR/AcrR family transcriptional regulator n=1 Tax=Nocardia colli TaxID=2545717 RepID=UPI0035D93B61
MVAQSAARRTRTAVRMPPEQRKQQLLDSALALVVRSGYANATMQAIAHEAGVTRPVVYEFYRDRTELLRDLLEREAQTALTAALTIVPDRVGEQELGVLLRSMLDRFLHLVVSTPQTWRLILAAPSGAPADVRDGIDATRAAILAALQAYLEPPQHAVEFDTEMLAVALLLGGESAARLVLKDPNQFPPERISAVAEWVTGQFAIGRTQ